ncbi:TonB-dependent receptor family protein [Hymenobacter actinosclerus]|uniref:Carboxypeptidase regulatory-like domain-containing protein n=1 Tax=Hymenobacter actinosclerus TaxID=82805 RepID=A0A1H9ZE24_9BACT|nr:TonB-dependent receptor family protein [Hymenobacter actinosclerus]SES79325.1 Carboxypeptidase regulatory-like domain-containing protein [Hymenobacter actinosclerus]
MKTASASLLLLAALVAAPAVATAQTTPAKTAAGRPTAAAALSGTVADSLTGQPLAFATMVVRKSADPAFVLSTMTDEKGAFRFEGLAAGTYNLLGTYIGYRNGAVEAVVVSANTADNKPLTMALAPDRNLLKEVKVTGNRPFIELRADKVVLNVAESPIAQGGTAAEVLSRAPGVVEQGGRYQVRGKTALVLIDGKLTNLGGTDLASLLASLPSNTLDKVEVVANPSARYDANGGAVINILTKKNSAFGTNGSVSAGVGAGRFARYNGGATLSYRRDKLNIFGGLDYLRTRQYRRFESNRVLGQETRIAEASYSVTGRNSQTARLNFDYDLTKRSSVGLQIRGIVSARETDGNTNSAVAGLAGPPNATNALQTNGTARGFNPTVSVYYRTLLDSAGSELKLNADYLTFHKRFDEQYRNAGYNLLSEEATTNELRTYSPARNSVASFTADYTRTLGKTTALEAGLKSLRTVTDNDINWENLADDGNWLNDARRTNHFVYREYINAGYASLRRPMSKKIGLQLGLRAEHTHSEGESLTLGQVNRRDYFNLFPNVSLDYAMSEKQQWNFSYRRNIDRFRFDIVNPFLTYLSPYLYYQGNPNIRPSFSHNFSVSHSYNNAVATSVSYGRHTNALAEVFHRDPATNIVIQSDANLSRATTLDANVSLTKQLGGGAITTANFVGATYVRFYSPSMPWLNQSSVGVMASSNTTLNMPNGLRAELNLFYRTPLTYGAYAFRAQYNGSVAVSKPVLKEKGMLTLTVLDPLNLQKSRYDTRAAEVQAYSLDKTETRFVRLNFSYRFGNQKVKIIRARRTGIEAEKMRLEN